MSNSKLNQNMVRNLIYRLEEHTNLNVKLLDEIQEEQVPEPDPIPEIVGSFEYKQGSIIKALFEEEYTAPNLFKGRMLQEISSNSNPIINQDTDIFAGIRRNIQKI